MTAEVELFKTDDYHPVGKIPLGPLLQTVFEPLVGKSLADSRFQLRFHAVPDASELAGKPLVVNLKASHGYVSVRIVDQGRILYQHPHSVREVVAAPLRKILIEHDPEATHWGFGVTAPGLEDLPLVRPVPVVDHQVDIAVNADRPRRFHVEQVAEPEPPTATLSELGVDGEIGPGDRVGVVVDEHVYAELTTHIRFSPDVEEGGFLTGRVYRADGHPRCYVVMITAAVRAERTGASLLRFTFTGESFLRMGQRLDSGPDEDQLVGWYHTHLFPASSELGLSTIDDELHTTTFRQPWQVAGLVNIDRDHRVLRFYQADGTEMVTAPYWVTSA